jgi:hypothetical protein
MQYVIVSLNGGDHAELEAKDKQNAPCLNQYYGKSKDPPLFFRETGKQFHLSGNRTFTGVKSAHNNH